MFILIVEFVKKPPQRIEHHTQDGEQSVENDNYHRPEELIESVFYSALGHLVGMLAEGVEYNPDIRTGFKNINGKPSAFPIVFGIAEFTFAMIRRTNKAHTHTPLQCHFNDLNQQEQVKACRNHQAQVAGFIGLEQTDNEKRNQNNDRNDNHR